jgi:hypothetical protein
MLRWLFSQHIHRLDQLSKENTLLTADRLEYFNRQIRHKLTEVLEDGEELPEESDEVILFTDCMRLEIAIPYGNDNAQWAVFTTHKHMHSEGIMGSIGPDGIFYHIYSNPLGRFPDTTFQRRSQLSNRISNHMRDVGYRRPGWTYTDKGFYRERCVRCTPKGRNVSDEQKRKNAIMSSGRISVEWGFGKVYHVCPLLNNHKYLQLQKLDVNMILKVAVLLTNDHTILKGANHNTYFNTNVPFTLERYFD